MARLEALVYQYGSYGKQIRYKGLQITSRCLTGVARIKQTAERSLGGNTPREKLAQKAARSGTQTLVNAENEQNPWLQSKQRTAIHSI